MKLNPDTLTTAFGGGAAAGILAQIDFSRPGWWKQAVVAAGVAVFGYYTNKK